MNGERDTVIAELFSLDENSSSITLRTLTIVVRSCRTYTGQDHKLFPRNPSLFTSVDEPPRGTHNPSCPPVAAEYR